MDGQVLGIRGTRKTVSSGWSTSSVNLDSGEQETTDVCSAGHGDEMWQMRLDFEGRDAGVGLVFIRDTSEKQDNHEEGFGAGGGGDVSVQ